MRFCTVSMRCMYTGKNAFAKQLAEFRHFYSTKSGSSKRWIDRAQRDPYTKQAQFDNFRSRAAFKLIQLDQKFHFFRPGDSVVDLGYAPGAWTQVAVKRTSPKGRVLGVDLIPSTPPKGASAIQANIFSKKTHIYIKKFFSTHTEEFRNTDPAHQLSYIEAELRDDPAETPGKDQEKFPVDLVLSDMYDPVPPPERFWNNTTNIAYYRMANTTGLVAKDHFASINLCDAALILAIDLLKPGGSFVCKFFAGSEDGLLEKRLQKVFERVIRDKPAASRSESRECYFICLRKKKDVDKMEVFS